MGSHLATSGILLWKAVSKHRHLAKTRVVFREGINTLQLAGEMQGGKGDEASQGLHQLRCHLLGRHMVRPSVYQPVTDAIGLGRRHSSMATANIALTASLCAGKSSCLSARRLPSASFSQSHPPGKPILSTAPSAISFSDSPRP